MGRRIPYNMKWKINHVPNHQPDWVFSAVMAKAISEITGYNWEYTFYKWDKFSSYKW